MFKVLCSFPQPEDCLAPYRNEIEFVLPEKRLTPLPLSILVWGKARNKPVYSKTHLRRILRRCVFVFFGETQLACSISLGRFASSSSAAERAATAAKARYAPV